MQPREHIPPNELPPGLKPPQFRLSTIFLVIAGLGGIFAAMVAVGPIGAFALMMLVLSLFAHVAGNALGTQLRSIGNETTREQLPGAKPLGKRVEAGEFAPTTPLSNRSRLTLTMIASTIMGALLIGLPAGLVLTWFVRSQANVPTVIVAMVSCLVLGGVLGFAASSFTQIAGGAWWQARRESKPK